MEDSLSYIINEWLEENNIHCRNCKYNNKHRSESPCNECIVNTDIQVHYEPK